MNTFRVVRRRWRIITVSVLMALAIGGLMTYRATPQYVSHARLFISTTERSTTDAYQGALFSVQRVSSYADLASGREIAARVVNDLHLNMDPSQLAAKVNAMVVPNTVIIDIAVTDSNPQRTQRIATSVSEELRKFVSELETPPGRSRPLIKATITDTADLPTVPISPAPKRNIGMALILGLLVGVGLAVLRELLDTSIKGLEDVSTVTDAPVLGGILLDPSTTRQPLLTDLAPQAPRAEAFRILRTNLQFIDVDHDKKVFVVTSPAPREGKTTTASNMALALCDAGERTLLVDADLRHPQLARIFGIEESVGLTSVLLGRIHLDEAVQKHPASDLDVLTSGTLPPNPAELLQSHAMEQLLTKARAEYDVIVIDTPPLLPVTDAAVIAAQADGALLVLRQGRTTRDQLAHTLERLAAVGARPLGVALNMIPVRRRRGYGYGYAYRKEPVEVFSSPVSGA